MQTKMTLTTTLGFETVWRRMMWVHSMGRTSRWTCTNEKSNSKDSVAFTTQSHIIFRSISHTSPFGPWRFATTASIASFSLVVNVKEWVRTFSRRWSFRSSMFEAREWEQWYEPWYQSTPSCVSYLISHTNNNGCYTWSIEYIALSDIGYIALRAPTARSHFCGNGIHGLQQFLN